MDLDNRRIIEAIVIGIIVGITILIREYYTVTNFTFVCNDTECKITHYNRSGKIISYKDYNKADIKEFEYQLERRERNWLETKSQRRQNRQVYYIYVKNHDCSKYKLSPLFIRKDALYYAERATNELNEQLKTKNINYTFR